MSRRNSANLHLTLLNQISIVLSRRPSAYAYSSFVSFSEQMDTSTPAGKMVFTVLGAVAELERSLIVERVRAGLRNARAKGKKLGRPRVAVDAARIACLHSEGRSIREIADELGCSRSLVHKTLANAKSRSAANAGS
jgi:DNA invertase Pin-like site-specific DNA recombinase